MKILSIFSNYFSLKHLPLILGLLSRRRKKQFLLLAILSAITGLLDSLSISLIIPILNLLSESNIQSKVLQSWYFKLLTLNNILPLPTYAPFILFIVVLILASIVRVFNIYLNMKFSSIVAHDLSREILSMTVLRPYELTVNRNSSLTISAVVNKVGYVVSVLNSTLSLFIAVNTTFFIFIAFLFTSWKVSLFSGFLVSSSYILIAKRCGRLLVNNSKIISDYENKQIDILQECVGSTREVIINNAYNYYSNNFKKVDSLLRSKRVIQGIIALFPRYLIEIIIILNDLIQYG